MAKVLVIGGAGYVGSSNVAWLKDRGHFCWVVDSLATSRRKFALGDGFTLARAGDRDAIARVLRAHSFDCVMHFAASTIVSESVTHPQKYFENNVEQTRLLLDTLVDHGVKNFIFSSTCAVFGDPGTEKIHEGLPYQAVSPYGESKIQAEHVIREFVKNRGLRAVILRYFNAAGADSHARTGEWHEPETHLIPNILRAIASGGEVSVFGRDYPTPDGTCIRDYIHVSDLASAHEKALQKLLALDPQSAGYFADFNLGSETGYSVLEVIRTCEAVTGHPIPIRFETRRPGDAPRLVGDSSRAKAQLGYQVCHDLTRIVKSAWVWEKVRMEKRKAAFLDRDGTINFDPGYLNDPKDLYLLDGVGEALQALKKAGYILIMVSNQSGVGRGLITPEKITEIHARLDELLEPYGVWIDDYALCFHRPDENCDCRKPNPKMILEMADRWNIDLSKSIMIGDRDTDVLAGRRAQCGFTGWIEHKIPGVGKAKGILEEPPPEDELYDFRADSLRGITQAFLQLPPAGHP